MTQNNEELPTLRAGGLVTVAYLKARLDEGSDHLDIFFPLVLDVISRLPNQDFATSDVQEALASTHGVTMPQETVATLLKRATHRDYLQRSYGRYIKNPQKGLPLLNVTAEKIQIEEGQRRLGDALRAHSQKRGLNLSSSEAALDHLFKFLEDEQVVLLLGGAPRASDESDESHRIRLIIAEFIHDAIRGDVAFANVLRGMIEGLVLYKAAFLPDLNQAVRSFKDLRVIFDSSLVRQALGYEGDGLRVLMRETINILKASGAQCLVLDKTLQEIRRLLRMFQEKLATGEGRRSLRHYAMDRHFLNEHFSPSDVREMSALLEREVSSAGFQILPAPPRDRRFTAGEAALSQKLADPIKKDELEPRVVHDVDCIAAVLTLRKGHRASAIEDARVIFATSSSLLIKNTRQWWEESEHESGVAPLIHTRALSNMAWLKKPSVSADYKMNELVALCKAAMSPSAKTWLLFLKHLSTLKESNRLTSDEEAALVISSMSDRLLMEVELEKDPNDRDAHTLNDIVDRVKASYGDNSEKRAREVMTAYEAKLTEAERRSQVEIFRLENAERSAAEKLRRQEVAIDGRARSWARAMAWTFQGLLSALLITGAVALMLGHPFHGGTIGLIVGIAVCAFVVAETIGLLGHLTEMRARLEIKLAARLRRWLGGNSKPE